MDHFQDLLINLEDESVTGYTEALAWDDGTDSIGNIEIIDIECVLLSFLSKNFVSTNGGFIRPFWLVLDSYAENFVRLRGVRLFFFCQAKFTER